MVVTLTDVYELGKIRVKLWDGYARYYQYKVEVATSLSGPWQTVVDRTSGQHSSWCEDAFPATAAKYVRITGTGNSANAGFHVVELEAYTGRSRPSRPPSRAPLPSTSWSTTASRPPPPIVWSSPRRSRRPRPSPRATPSRPRASSFS